MTNADQRIAALATGQLGAFTRAQAVDAGLSDRQLRSRVKSGILIQTGPNSFRFAGAPRSLRDELFDLVLDVGPPVWVTGPTLAALYGWDGYALRRPFHLVVPRERAVSRTNARIARRDGLRPIDLTELDGLPVLAPARGLIELARYASAAHMAAAVDSAIRDGQIVERALHERIVDLRSQGRHGLPLLAEVLAGAEVTRGGNSWLEREYLRLLDAAGLPRPDLQQVLSRTRDQLVRVDCRFPGTNVIVELLGYRWHRSRQQMSRDAARANALIADGFRPFQFTYAHVVSEPSYVTETTRRALTLRAAS